MIKILIKSIRNVGKQTCKHSIFANMYESNHIISVLDSTNYKVKVINKTMALEMGSSSICILVMHDETVQDEDYISYQQEKQNNPLSTVLFT